MFDKIFLSYAKEDYRFAEKLYSHLESLNLKPWLDKKKLLPGQDWNFVLRKELKEANFIILLLSKNSVTKRGYVQREFRLALEYYEEKLDDDIYLIPLKIDDCQVPDKLSKFQWVEFKEGFESISKAIEIQRKKYITYEEARIKAYKSYDYETNKENFRYGDKIILDIDIEYAQFINDRNLDLKEVNDVILGKKSEIVFQGRRFLFNAAGELMDQETITPAWNLSASFSVNLISNSIISITENNYGYFGGAHGSGMVTGLNFQLNPVFLLALEDLFDYVDHLKILKFLSNYCFEHLKIKADEFFGTKQNDIDLFWEDSLSPKWKNFEHFLISKNGIEIIFNSYSVSGYAFGVHGVNIPFDEILKVLKKPRILNNIISKL